MSQAERTANSVEPFFPSDISLRCSRPCIERCQTFNGREASDSLVLGVGNVCRRITALREVPGVPQRLRLDDILAALKQLDDENDPPPRGGLAMRLPRFSNLECIASDEPQRIIGRPSATRRHRSVQASRTENDSRWTREENVRPYRKLLNTRLTDIERDFIKRRLAEELQGRSVVKRATRNQVGIDDVY